MNKEYLILLILAVSPFALVFIHIIFVHLAKLFKINISGQLLAILTELLFNIPVLLIIYSINNSPSTLIYSFIVYNCLGYSYFHFYNLSETARRIRILIEVKNQKSISKEELMSIYKPDIILSNRLDRLIKLGQIRLKENGKYILSGKILWLSALIIAFLRNIFGFNDSGENIKRS
jgi:hypothetical protein